MNCKQLEQEWIDRVSSSGDAAPAWSQAAEQHFAACAECRQVRDSEKRLDRAIVAWRQQSTPEWTPSLPLSELQIAPQPQPMSGQLSVGQRSSRDLRGVLTALVATCAVAIVALVSFPRAGIDEVALQTPPSPAANSSDAEADLEVTALMSELWHDVRDGSANAAQITVSTTAASLALPATLSDARPSVEPANTDDLAAADESSLPWLELGRPVSQQIGAALQFLGEALPSSGEPAS